MTKRSLIVIALGVSSLCSAAAASAQQPRWGRERLPQSGACFYQDRDFGGQYFCVRPGEDLRSMPSGMNDRISSIRLLGASEVTVFKDNDMRGRSAFFTRDVYDLRNDGWNDAISSIAVTNSNYYNNRNGTYNNGNGNGRGRGRNRDYRDDPNYRDYRNDPNYRDYRDDPNYRDYRNDPNYRDYRNDPYGYDPNTAPVWGRQNVPREGACFYQDANFRGQYFCVPRGGTYASLPNGFNDRISSVRVFGASVQIYDDRDFRGHSTEIRRDNGDLKGRWRDTVSSIRVF